MGRRVSGWVLSSDSSISDYCRLCTISFKVKFGSNLGKQSHSSSETLFRPSNERIALGLCQPKFVKKLDCRLFISCNILIGSVTHVAGKFVFWASFTISLKLQIHPRQVPRLRAANILLPRRTKPAQHGENQNSSVSILGRQSHYRSKVPRRLLKANQESLSPSLFWTKLKNLLALALFWPQKRSKKMLLQTKLTCWTQRDTTSAKKNHIHGLDENRLVFQILRHFGKK